MIDDANLSRSYGIESGWVFYDDLHIDPYVDMTLDLSDSRNVTASVQHITGDSIMSFGITSRAPNGKCDFRVDGLKPDSYYRLQFDGALTECAGGFTHAKTTPDGQLRFNEVVIPNE